MRKLSRSLLRQLEINDHAEGLIFYLWRCFSIGARLNALLAESTRAREKRSANKVA